MFTGAVSAQKMSVSLDAAPLVKGFIWSDSDAKNSCFALAPSFEYLLQPGFTLGANADLYIGKVSDIDILYFGLAAQGRWYTHSEGMDKFFIGGGLGIGVFALDGKTDKKKGGFMDLSLFVEAGYRAMFNPQFFVEPSRAYVYGRSAGSGIPIPLGWQAGLSIGMAF